MKTVGSVVDHVALIASSPSGATSTQGSTPRIPVLPSGVVSRLTARGWLDSPWPAVVLAGLFLLAVGLLVWVVRHRRRLLPVTGAVAAVLVTALLAAAAGINAFAGYVPDTLAAERVIGMAGGDGGGGGAGGGTHTAGIVRSYEVDDPALKVPPSPVWVYLPPGYNRPGNTTRYPVVYLLHGYPGRSVDWFAAGRIDVTMNALINERAMPPAIVVAPDMNAGALPRDTEGLNIVGGPQVQAFLTSTVPAWADATFRTIPSWQDRIIGGMSAGGYVALNLGLKYQNVFGGIIAQQPYGDPGLSTLPELHGNVAAYVAQSPWAYLLTMHFVRPEPAFIDVGGSVNPTGPKHLAWLLSQRHQPVYFRIEPGQRHTWTEARVGIAYGLVWVADELHWSAAGARPHGARPL